MRSRVTWGWAAALAAAGAVHSSAQPAQETFRSGRDVLRIDTSVSAADGRPLVDLQPSEFTVRIDGDARQVLTVHRFGADAATPTNEAPPVAGFAKAAESAPGRIVLIVIDRPSIKAGSERGAVDAAAALLDGLSAADAVAAVGLPGGGVDLTRDHAAVSAAIRSMTGTQPTPDWQHYMTWDEALAYEKDDRLTIATVLQRECPKIKASDIPDECPPALARQGREMLLLGRAQGQTTLTALTNLLSALTPLHAPKHMVILSGGLVFDVDLYARYQMLAQKAAESHVALSVVHLDQALDASDRGHFANVFGGREYANGLGTVASMTGGAFFMGVGSASGVFQRIASQITNFYELGVESRPSDADGKAHRVEVKVSRAGAAVRAPAETATRRPADTPTAELLTAALREPTDVAELPLEVATYSTHSSDPEKVAVIVAAQLAAAAVATAADWGYAIIDGAKVVGGSRVHVDQGAAQPWAASAKIDIAPGRYRLRAAVVATDGRVGTLDLPLRVGLRQAGPLQASDLVVGSADGGRLQPRARVRQDEPAVGMIELSSGEPLTGTGGEIVLTRGGTAEPAARRPLKLRTREDDKSIVVAEAALDLASLPAGLYTASAVLQKGGAPVARVSRVFEVLPGAAAPPAAALTTPPAAAPITRDPALDEMLQRVGAYVEHFGTDASVLVAVEHYKQSAVDATASTAFSGASAPRGRGAVAAPTIEVPREEVHATDRKLVAELALVQNAAVTGGWLAFRDVTEVDGKAVPDRRDRLQSLFRAGTPDLDAAKRITAENARFNVGPVTRTFNVPTAALFFFTPLNLSRFTYRRAGSERIDGVEVWKVEFDEARRPSLIMTSAGADVPSSGTLWINPVDASVLRTRLVVAQYRGARSRAEVEVAYRRDETLGMLIPVRMTERYLTPVASITGEATYSDFKRFQTSATFKVK